jgi:hypothetical protein
LVFGSSARLLFADEASTSFSFGAMEWAWLGTTVVAGVVSVAGSMAGVEELQGLRWDGEQKRV